MTLRPLHFTADQTPLPPCANPQCNFHLTASDVANEEIYCSEDCRWDCETSVSALFDDPDLLESEDDEDSES